VTPTADIQPYRILVTGWRDWPAEMAWFVGQKIHAWIGGLNADVRPHVVVMQGKCPYGGVDLWAERFCEREGIACESHPAGVDRGRLLGPARNQRMVELVDPMYGTCLAFPGPGSSPGTRDCYSKAARAGLTVHIYPYEYAFMLHGRAAR
jgi:hypothetical protein